MNTATEICVRERRYLLASLMVLIVAVVLAPAQGRAAPGDIFYVHGDHPNANDNNDGRTLDSPWRTIIKAANTLRAGETVRVRAGTYTEFGIPNFDSSGFNSGILVANSGQAGNPIVLEAYPGERPIIDQQNQAPGFHVFFDTFSYITIRGFEIRNAYQAGVWARDGMAHSNIVVENCYIHHIDVHVGGNAGGVRLDGAPSCDACVVRNNVIHTVRVAGEINMNGSAVHSYGLRNGIIENNELYDAANGYRIKGEPQGTPGGTVVRRNIIHDVDVGVSYGGMWPRGLRGERVYENIMYNIRNSAVLSIPSLGGHDGLQFYNNVVEGTSGALGIALAFQFLNVESWNNIFLVPSPGNNYQLNNISAPQPSSITYSNYNIFAQSQNFVLDNYAPNQRDFGTLAAWQSGTGFDANSLTADPRFVNRAAHDYHLAAGSPALGAGRYGDNIGAYRTGAEVIGPGAGVVGGSATLEFSGASYSVNEAGGSATITVTRTGSSADAVSVGYATANGTATAGADYTSASGTLSWAAGDSASKTFTVALTNDTDIESNETVNLTLSNPSGGAMLGVSSATLTITDDDTATAPPPPSSPPPSTASVSSGGGCTLGTAQRGPDPTLPLLLGVALVWLGVRRRTALPLGVLSLGFLFHALKNRAGAYRLGLLGSAALLCLSFSKPTLAINVTLPYSLGFDTPEEVDAVAWATYGATATYQTAECWSGGCVKLVPSTVPDTYAAVGEIFFPPTSRVHMRYLFYAGPDYARGLRTHPKHIIIHRGTDVSGDRGMLFFWYTTNDLADPTRDYAIGVCDNIDCLFQGGGNRPTGNQSYLIGQHAGQWVAIEAVFDTTAGRVRAYVTTQDGSLNEFLIAEHTLHSVTPSLDYWNRISVLGNYGGGEVLTPGMYFMLDELVVSTSYIGPPAGFVTGNLPPTLQFSAATYSVAENAGTATITVARSGSSTEAVTVNYATGTGSALAGADYTTASGVLSWAAGDSTPKTFTVAITNDLDVEDSETVNFTLSNPTGAVLGLSGATLTISDDDMATAPVPSSSTSTSGSSGGGCTLGRDWPVDPTLPILLVIALFHLLGRRHAFDAPATGGR